jgi:hypothetical protein
MITGELVKIEVQPTRLTRVVLEKFVPGPLLSSLAPAASFFYRVTLNGELKACTENPVEAREAWRDCCRWAVTA